MQALRDGRSLAAFQRLLLEDSARWGLGPDAVGALIEGALAFQGRALLSAWRFLVKKPLTAADLPRLHAGLDSWRGSIHDVVHQVRANPYVLIQADRELLQEWFPKAPQKERRAQWMRFLDDRWAKAPERDPALHQQWRMWAAVLAVLIDQYDQGHTYIYLQHRNPNAYGTLVRPILDGVRQYLGEPTLSDDAVRQIIRDVIAFSGEPNTPVVRTYRIVKSRDGAYEKVYWMWVYQGERALANQVEQRLVSPALPWPSHGDALLARGYQEPGSSQFVPFDPDQQIAIRRAYTQPLTILAAPPGTGKTAVIWALHEIARHDSALADSGFFVLTPTGRASRIVNARVPSLAVPATTLHSRVSVITAQALRPNPEDREFFADAVRDGFVIVDEAFAADAGVLGALVREMGERGRLVLIGDPDQLLPVTGGSPALDVLLAVQEALDQKILPTAHNPLVSLRINHRSVATIPHNGRALWGDAEVDATTGQPRVDPTTGSLVIARHNWDAQHFPSVSLPDDPDVVLAELRRAVQQWEQQRGPGQASEDVWHAVTRRRDAAAYLNQELRRMLFPNVDAPWVVGDRVMQLHNDYLINGIGLRNGEFGHIVAIAGELITAEFASGTFTVSMRYANLHWDYGYVTTVHKSQGGEWPYVAVVEWPRRWVPTPLIDDAADLVMGTLPPDRRDSRWPTRWLYTAWTRAKDQVLFLIPDVDQAIADAARDPHQARQSNDHRRTQLRGWLRWHFQGSTGTRPGGPAKRRTL